MIAINDACEVWRCISIYVVKSFVNCHSPARKVTELYKNDSLPISISVHLHIYMYALKWKAVLNIKRKYMHFFY